MLFRDVDSSDRNGYPFKIRDLIFLCISHCFGFSDIVKVGSDIEWCRRLLLGSFMSSTQNSTNCSIVIKLSMVALIHLLIDYKCHFGVVCETKRNQMTTYPSGVQRGVL